jgi:hypothetical protein
MIVFQMCANLENDFQLLDFLDKERETTPPFASIHNQVH